MQKEQTQDRKIELFKTCVNVNAFNKYGEVFCWYHQNGGIQRGARVRFKCVQSKRRGSGE